MGELRYSFMHSLTSALMEVNGQLHAPAALPSGNEPLIPIGQEAGWAPESVWTQWGREKFPGFKPLIIQPIAQHYTTELSQLLVLQMCDLCMINVNRVWNEKQGSFISLKIEVSSLTKLSINLLACDKTFCNEAYKYA
jgi:hypothetical protein